MVNERRTYQQQSGRELVDLTNTNTPPPDQLKTPLYEARVEPDIYFFGFDLTVEEALGGTGETDADKQTRLVLLH
ncbi:MAG: hypothetical protein QM727_00015 [Niabella sp.]